MSRNYSSVAQEKTLSATINTTATQITLNSLDGFPSAPYALVLDPDTTSEEAVLVGSVASGTTLNVTRAIETNATAKSHTVGAIVRHMIVASDLQAISTHTDASTGVHGLAAGVAVVGRTTSQTLTSKTISLGDNTVTGTRAQFNTSMSDDDFATVSGTETLTNKTLTSPAINSPIIVFEGATDDAYETTIAVVDPTADRTITLPNVTGTVVTTGDTGTVTSTMIFDGTIVNADINDTAAIASTKISGTAVTLAGTETLTNKTINLSSNTLSGTVAQFNAALSGEDFATLTGSERLSNKQLYYQNTYQPSIYTSTTATQTLTGTVLDQKILRYSGSSSPNHTWTMPTVTDLNNYFTTASTGFSIDFSIINTNTSGTAGILTLATNTGLTLIGYMSILDDESALFRLHKTDTSTWSVYRIA